MRCTGSGTNRYVAYAGEVAHVDSSEPPHRTPSQGKRTGESLGGRVSPMDRRERAVLIAFIALAVLLRFATLDAKSFWQDEAGTAFVARLGLLSMLHAISRHETT